MYGKVKKTAKFLIPTILLASLLFPFSASATTVQYTANDTFTVPTGVTSLFVEVWAAGGNSGTHAGPNGSEGGGGGGAYSNKTIPVTSGDIDTVTVGASGGADSWFIDAGTVLAKGGSNVPNDTATHGQGGQAASGIGDVTHSGGDGGDGGLGVTPGGGGGGGAGSTGDGGTASGQTGGTGTSLNGGNGGNGASAGTGSNGNVYGGGSGGCHRASGTCQASTGAGGLVQITYTVPPVPPAPSQFNVVGGTLTVKGGSLIIK